MQATEERAHAKTARRKCPKSSIVVDSLYIICDSCHAPNHSVSHVHMAVHHMKHWSLPFQFRFEEIFFKNNGINLGDGQYTHKNNYTSFPLFHLVL